MFFLFIVLCVPMIGVSHLPVISRAHLHIPAIQSQPCHDHIVTTTESRGEAVISFVQQYFIFLCCEKIVQRGGVAERETAKQRDRQYKRNKKEREHSQIIRVPIALILLSEVFTALQS